MFLKMKSVIPILLSAFICVTHSLNYDDLENTGISCPSRHSCEDMDEDDSDETHCKCDSTCSLYGDCCIDAHHALMPTSADDEYEPPPGRNRMKCMQVGNSKKDTGVYVISDCKCGWKGPTEIREKCVAPPDFRDPVSAAPVARRSGRKTVVYRNRFCAECNDANMDSLTVFPIRMECYTLRGRSEEQFLSELIYNEELGSWGIPEPKYDGNGTSFFGCKIHFDVPEHLNETMRFCRSYIKSDCAPAWESVPEKRLCDEYMAVVYDRNGIALRNPHCARCNFIDISDDIFCNSSGYLPHGYRVNYDPNSFALLLDINPRGGDKVGKQQCPSGHIYDPFAKKCKRPGCALPGYKIVNGKCVEG